MNLIKACTLVLVLAAMPHMARAQEYPVSTGSITDCGGFLVDSGFSSGDYTPNENYTCVICHDGTDLPQVNLYFAYANLGTGDQISIYDGNNTSAPLIGTYTGSQLQSQTISSTNGNGCLTVVFTSNSDSSVGSFGAEISCGLPCEHPIVHVTANQPDWNPIKLCIGESVTFDASTTEFFNGTQVANFTWDFDDGTTDNSSWPTVTHTFQYAGAYVVQLEVEDDNDCNSTMLPDVLVFVATEPTMVTTANDYQVCVGQTVNITGSATPVEWSAIPDNNFGGGLFIPDDQTQCFSDDLLFSGFTPGATVNSINDLVSFYINFEHSYMGDLVITFICPNGQSLTVHQQGGGGTWLGNPVDDESLTPGEGWDYWWSPTATLGTWAAEAGNLGSPLPSGTYSAVQSWSQLIGCPLNGAWTVEVCDMWAIDNGYIFDWSVQFAPNLYPELISFTPSIGAGCDSTFWQGSFITNTSTNCNNITIVPTDQGTFTYTFNALDNHGCSYTQSIQIEAYPGPTANAGSDLPFCSAPVGLTGQVGNTVNGINYLYNWTPQIYLSGANTLTPTVTSVPDDQLFVFTVYPQNDPQCQVSDTVLVFVPDAPGSAELDSLEFCAGLNAVLVAPDIQNGYQYQWLFGSQNLGNGSSQIAASTGDYTVIITEPVCGFSSSTPFYAEVLSCLVIIPNVFTPNQDGDNDNLVFYGLENFNGSTLRVYNRWGNLVYSSDNYKNNWNPSMEEASEGTYFFILGINKFGNFDYHEGHLTLLRQ